MTRRLGSFTPDMMTSVHKNVTRTVRIADGRLYTNLTGGGLLKRYHLVVPCPATKID